MLIECRYYDIDLEMTKQMEKELAEEEDALTETEKSEEQKESAKMYEEIVRKGEEHENIKRFRMPIKWINLYSYKKQHY